MINHREGTIKNVHSRTTWAKGKGGWSGKSPNPLNNLNFFEKGVDDFRGRL
ncbi:hypothetical protein YSA_01234 [Pseudomonas putida ND6]|uniref:Uncharacterized protein n=1 Tax=Pseudomonas putida ND6 TaxID=231023 RepID=I3UPM5_PSEPU|nr:hypothetical protein YSA_01234 [Pseudomonas putida ND6]